MANPKKKVSKTNDAEMQASERNSEFMRLRKEITAAPAPASFKYGNRYASKFDTLCLRATDCRMCDS